MNGYRISEVDGERIAIPSPINISELVEIKEFSSPLIHFSDRQWNLTLSNLESIKEVPEKAIVMKAFRLADGYGVNANPFIRCPKRCEPIFGRGLVCPDNVELGFTPDPDCYFEPHCNCEQEVHPPIVQGTPISGCNDSECQLSFVPLKVKFGSELTLTIMRLKCVKVNGTACKKCRTIYSHQSNFYAIGCICDDC